MTAHSKESTIEVAPNDPPAPAVLPVADRYPSGALLLLLLLLLLPVEWVCARSTYYTHGEVDQALWFWPLIIGNAGAIYLWVRGRHTLALYLAIAIGLFIIPYTGAWLYRYALIQSEMAQIVFYAQDYKRQQGNWPADLTNYTFQHPWTQDHIRDFSVDRNGHFHLLYSIASSNTAHWYSSATGWGYYPD